MPQLVNHGKKTVPAGIRPDIWRPYFTIQFPDNDGGRKAGLQAYRRLREFSLRHQLDPPKEELITTQDDVDRAIRRYGDPAKLRNLYRNGQTGKIGRQFQLPLLGQKLPQKLRAQKLMDQKATSVADASFILRLSMEQLQNLYGDKYDADQALLETTEAKLQDLGKRGRKRLRIIRRQEEEKAAEIARRQDLAKGTDIKDGQLLPDMKLVKAPNMQFRGYAMNHGGASEPSASNTYETACEIQITWADIRDGLYAESWPAGVYHDELQPTAVHPDSVAANEKLLEKKEAQREAQIEATRARSYELEKQRLTLFYQKYFETKDLAVRVEELHKMHTLGEPLSTADTQAAESKDSVIAELEELEQDRLTNEDKDPALAEQVREEVELRNVVNLLRGEQNETTQYELRRAEESSAKRYTAAKEIVEAHLAEDGTPEEGTIEQAAFELIAPAKPAESRGTASVVVPNEQKGVIGRMRSWAGR
jgi:hypothetical protein